MAPHISKRCSAFPSACGSARPLCHWGVVLALLSVARCQDEESEVSASEFENQCGALPAVPSGCLYAETWPCCPAHHPYGTYRRRQAFEPLLLQRVATLYPLASGADVSAAGFPPFVAAPPLRIMVGMTVHRIFDINQRSQTFGMHYRLRFLWRDCRLLHNCSWVMVSHTHPAYNLLWRPSFKIDEQETTDPGMFNEMLFFSPDGLVSWTAERASSFRCAFDFTNLPFDVQMCNLTFMMPFGDKGMITIVPMLGPNREVAIVENVVNAEWDIAKSPDWMGEEVFLWRELNNVYSEVQALRLRFPLKRKPRSMLINFVFPAVMYYLASWLGLWIDPAAVPARAAIGVVPVLIMTNKLSSLTDVMPPISYSVRLENFLMSTLTFIVLQMLEFGFVNYGLRQQSARKKKEPPPHEVATVEVLPASQSAMRVGVEELAGQVRRSDSSRWQTARDMSHASFRVPDRIAAALGAHTDVHFRWISLLTYILTSSLILLA